MNPIRRITLGAVAALALVAGLAVVAGRSTAQQPAPAKAPANPAASGAATATAIFAGGCFWCTEADFDKVAGVLSTTSGYIGGKTANPTYQEVSSHVTGHAEAVKIVFDPARVRYEQLLDVYWRSIDPTVRDRQFCDVGTPYRTAIFAVDDAQLAAARASLAALEKSKPFKEPIVTSIERASEFYPAEDYHQDYYRRNPVRYNYYRTACGRDQRLRQLWGKAAHAASP